MMLPAKFAERVLRDLGDSEGAALCAALDTEPPVSVRLNPAKCGGPENGGAGREEDADKAAPGQDSRSIQNWAISSVSFCIKNHLMQGDNRNAFNPTGNVNRAQVAKALSNIAAAAKK